MLDAVAETSQLPTRPHKHHRTHPLKWFPRQHDSICSELQHRDADRTKEIVRVFLEAMRKGDGQQLSALFTEAARKEIERQGISIEPPGSAQATFTIDDVTQQGEEILVSSTWLEPEVEGQPPQKMEVVWVLYKDVPGWRVAGMAVATGPTENDLELSILRILTSPPWSNQLLRKNEWRTFPTAHLRVGFLHPTDYPPTVACRATGEQAIYLLPVARRWRNGLLAATPTIARSWFAPIRRTSASGRFATSRRASTSKFLTADHFL
jgi:hypothetical protein